MRLTRKQKNEIKRLVRAECANHFPDDGGSRKMDFCVRRDRECAMMNPQDNKICAYFRECVLPNDPTLEAEILHKDTQRKDCAACGNEFIPVNNRQMYCPECSKIARKKKEAQRQRERRAKTYAFRKEKSLL